MIKYCRTFSIIYNSNRKSEICMLYRIFQKLVTFFEGCITIDDIDILEGHSSYVKNLSNVEVWLQHLTSLAQIQQDQGVSWAMSTSAPYFSRIMFPYRDMLWGVSWHLHCMTSSTSCSIICILYVLMWKCQHFVRHDRLGTIHICKLY
jgi:hypothetical protein